MAAIAPPLIRPRLAAPAAICAALIASIAAVVAPLAVYSMTLAAFGLPHVLSELRYVDRRFGRALGPRRIVLMAGLLALIVAARAAAILKLLPPAIEAPLELGLVALLALTAARGGPATRLAATGVALVVGALALVDPFETVIGFAILHNLTPLGFLWQLAPRERRPATMAWAAAAFLGLPLLVATGLPRMLREGWGVSAAALDPIGAGPLWGTLPVYVPSSLLGGGHAIDLFTASVVAQQAHYAGVIVVLPWLLSRWSPGARGLVPWPRGVVFYAVIAGLAAFAFAGFVSDFVGARALYSLAAAVHAWIEIPILIFALTSAQAPRARPTANEAAFVAQDSSSA